MTRNDNYPDDIRDFDHHPYSPFYSEPDVECKYCNSYIKKEDSFGLHEDDDTNIFCSEDCVEEYVKDDPITAYHQLWYAIDKRKSAYLKLLKEFQEFKNANRTTR